MEMEKETGAWLQFLFFYALGDTHFSVFTKTVQYLWQVIYDIMTCRPFSFLTLAGDP